jgi:alpha-methylacyl-CoA racemase
VERGTFVELNGIVQPAPAPRFSRTPGAVARPPSHAGQHTDEVLSEWLGSDAADITKLKDAGAIA